MKKLFLVFIFLGLLIGSCNDQVTEMPLSDLKDHNMKIIPEKPTSKDEIRLVVFDDCTYNLLSGITKNENTIDIEKQFNGMMKWPCFMKNDTILIGKLSKGNYTVNYKLMDIANPKSPQISFSFSFNLPVSL